MSRQISIIFLLLVLCCRLSAQTDLSSDIGARNHYRIFVYGGRGILLASTNSTTDLLGYAGVDDALRNTYFSKLKNGLTGGVDVYRMLNQNLGYGLKYQYFNTSSSIIATSSNISMYTDYNYNYNYTYNGDVSENIYMNYIGVALYSNIMRAAKTGLGINYSFSVGPAFYRNEQQFFTENTLITKTTFGADLSIGIDYHFIKQIALGVRISGFYALIPDVLSNDGTQSFSSHLDKPEFAARMNYVGYLSVDI